MESPNMGKLTSMHFYAWKKGLKTGMYYLRSKAASSAIKFTVKKNAQTDMSPGVSTSVTADTDELAPSASAPSQVEVEARVKVQKEALAEMSEKTTAKKKAECSVDNEEECTSCGS